jgi:hypothetical protein
LCKGGEDAYTEVRGHVSPVGSDEMEGGQWHVPRPPASETAAASLGRPTLVTSSVWSHEERMNRTHHCIPPWTTGLHQEQWMSLCFRASDVYDTYTVIPSSSVSFVRSMLVLLPLAERLATPRKTSLRCDFVRSAAREIQLAQFSLDCFSFLTIRFGL